MQYKIIHFKCILLVSWLFVISSSIFCQKAPIKFGKIDRADLEMKTYPSDTSAPAAILCNYGYFDSHQLQFVWNIRIKIFKKEGVLLGDQIFPLSSESSIKGITFNIENGQIVESKLKSESIFKERVTNDYYRVRVAMPNVKEGSIIDMEFFFQGIPMEWRFQEKIPVRWSELVIEPSSFLVFSKTLRGFEPLAESSDTRWVAKDMPAFKEEPYMNGMSNYFTKYDIVVKSRYGTNSWETINNVLDENKYFGEALIGTMYLNNIAKEIENKYTDPLDKLTAAHAAVKKIKWNEKNSLFSSSTSLSYVYNKKIGNSADINMILIQLLRKLNFEVYPLALSTRDNGFITLSTPSIQKLNYVIAYTSINNKPFLLDATEELMPIGLLPSRCINLMGRIVDNKKPEWVELKTDKKLKNTIQYDLNLETDYQITGKMKYSRYDYSAFDFRKFYRKFNSQDEYLKNFESENKGLSVITYSIKNIDSIYNPVLEEYNVKIKNKVKIMGNILNINPMMFEQMYENPFKIEERKYPVDFMYPRELIYTFKLNIPKGYKVIEIPKPLIIKLPNNTASCMYQMVNFENVIQLTYKYSINKPIFDENEYTDLRSFFSEVVKKNAEVLVLKIME